MTPYTNFKIIKHKDLTFDFTHIHCHSPAQADSTGGLFSEKKLYLY